MVSTKARNQPGRTRVSEFSNTTNGPGASRIAGLLPRPNPQFPGLRRTRTHGWFASTHSADPSVEALSTTTVSHWPAG